MLFFLSCFKISPMNLEGGKKEGGKGGRGERERGREEEEEEEITAALKIATFYQ